MLYEGTKQVDAPRRADYYLTDDLADRASQWIISQTAVLHDKPFFLYFATGATHAPHHVPADWIARYHGKFDSGWDEYRKQVFVRQKAMGIIPDDTKLPPMPKEIPAWSSFTAQQQHFLARQMEAFAAFGSYTDHQIGRVLDALDKTGQRSNTLVIYILGDNGASVAGGVTGTVNEWSWINGVKEPIDWQMKQIGKWGGRETFPEVAAAWGIAGNTPFSMGKTLVQNYGATRNGMIVSWPQRIRAKGAIRSQWLHVVDIAPTILGAAGNRSPKRSEASGNVP